MPAVSSLSPRERVAVDRSSPAAHLARLFQLADRVPIRPRVATYAAGQRVQRLHFALAVAIDLANLRGVDRMLAIGERRAWWRARAKITRACLELGPAPRVRFDVVDAVVIDLAAERERRRP